MPLLPPGRVRSSTGLVIAATLTVVLLACSSTPERSLPTASTVRYVQVVAHADDDVIFMNPDLASGIRAGQATVGIYLTAGETDKADAEAYAARRQAGTRAAYARMAGVADNWRAERLEIDRDHAVEQYTLQAKPQVQVIFVNLPENNDPRAEGGRQALVRLWNDDRDALRVATLVPTGGAVQQQYFYTHNGVIRLLLALFDRLRPTVVRAQDPSPDKRYAKDWPQFHDHPDHVMAARFTEAATRLYQGPRFVSESYRDYNVSEVPANLSPADRQDKVDIFGAYVPHDSEVSLGNPYAAWLPRMYQRYPRGSTWAANGQAYAVFNGQLFGCKPGSDWATLPWANGPLAPAVSAAGSWVVGKRLADNEMMALIDGSWQAIGNPDRHAAGDPGEAGSPVTNGKAVYAKNGRGGLSVWRPGGGWTAIGGKDIQDGLAIAGDDVYASTRDGVSRWHNDQMMLDFQSVKPAGPPSAAVVPGGVAVAYRTDAGDIALSSPAGQRMLSGLAGSGNPTVLAVGPRVVVLARTSAGGLAVNSGAGWKDLGGQMLDQPAALGTDAVVLGPNGLVRMFSNL
jgi:LmbE family N-acetylglucosaminyl deacetylase